MVRKTGGCCLVKVISSDGWLHYGSVLSPLLFAVVMDGVSSETISGTHSELLYTYDLVLMS